MNHFDRPTVDNPAQPMNHHLATRLPEPCFMTCMNSSHAHNRSKRRVAAAMKARFVLKSFGAALLALACLAPGSPAGAALIERLIFPVTTDPDITGATTNNFRHVVHLDDSVPHPGRLFVFFPGTGGPPGGYRRIMQTAAEIGYHALGLAYVNDLSINFDICDGQPDPACEENARLEIIEGFDYSPHIAVNRANSIENRLIKLLQYLHQQYPGEGWNTFLDGEAIRWDLIAFAGHSQGGGHAALVGKIHSVHRVGMFSSTEPAAWTTEPSLTPSDRCFGFAHTLEDNYNGITFSWANLGVPGALTSVDAGAPPFAGSHRLKTTATPADGANFHGAVVTDPSTPLQPDGVTPLFRDVWIYMIGPAGDGPDPLPLIPSISGNDFKLEFPTMPGERFDIQTSPDLGVWTNAVSDLFAPTFSLEYVVPDALAAPRGFYRVQRK